MNNLGFAELKRLVIDKGLCVTCGTCIGVCPTQCLDLTYEDGEPLVTEKRVCKRCGICFEVCPGADIPIPELEQAFLGRRRKNEGEEDLGVMLRYGVAWATEEAIRKSGASGGLVTALVAYALESGLIDCALVAGFDSEMPVRPAARLATTKAELIEAASSKYSAVSTNMLLSHAVNKGYRRIGVVGCPCHIHGVRKIQYHHVLTNIAARIRLCVGITCGLQLYFEATRHLLHEVFAVTDFADVAKIEYRGGPWPDSYFVLTLKGGEERRIPRFEYMTHLLVPAFKRDRCEMCLDWAAELADVAAGDYWGPIKSPAERRRTSFIVRTSIGDELVKEAAAKGVIDLEEMDPACFRASIGYEIKKHGAAFKLLQRQRFGWPTPNYHYRPDYSPLVDETAMRLRRERLRETPK